MISSNDIVILLCAEGITYEEVDRRIMAACAALDTDDMGDDEEDDEDLPMDLPWPPSISDTFTECFLRGEAFNDLPPRFISPGQPPVSP